MRIRITTLALLGAFALLPAILFAAEPAAPARRTGVRPFTEGTPPRDVCEPITITMRTDRTRYETGDEIRLTVRTDTDAYLYVYSTDGAGITHQLLPNWYDQDNFARAHRTVSLPSSRYSLVTTNPGYDTIRVVAVAPGRSDWRPPSEYRTFSSGEPFRRWGGGTDQAIAGLRGSLFAFRPQTIAQPAPDTAWGEETLRFYVSKYCPPTFSQQPAYIIRDFSRSERSWGTGTTSWRGANTTYSFGRTDKRDDVWSSWQDAGRRNIVSRPLPYAHQSRVTITESHSSFSSGIGNSTTYNRIGVTRKND